MPPNIRLVVLKPGLLEPATSSEFLIANSLLLQSENRRAMFEVQRSVPSGPTLRILEVHRFFFNLFVQQTQAFRASA